ncbi:hypothetical protein Zm00014a_019102 [Zea mays]|uniref:TRF2/HOY1 PH-like domain-containing protein n=1 Tax=Zea mays TaxID=4577 RepID=A0A3L6EZH4_MAIZE|nr:hypothetical protein Zm00014a_019102 [Zea mays]
MVQLPGSKKRHAEMATAATVKAEVEDLGCGDGSPHKHVKPMPQPPPQPPPPELYKGLSSFSDLHLNWLQDLPFDVLDGPSPLGLRLRKSRSLVDLIQCKLFQDKSAHEQFDGHNNVSDTPMKKEVRSGAPTAGERMKASNFPANVLRIGSWEYISHYEGDLVAKCYFAKHKLVWEVLHNGLKSKIEIQWSDIIALKATCPENEQEGVLDLVLARPPLFFKETDPQPRKHTLWQAASDFTDGQASSKRRHILRCPSSLLSRNFEKLIQCDQRLRELSQQPAAILQNPGFEPKRSIFQNPNESKDCLDIGGLKFEHNKATLPKFTAPLSTRVFSSLSNNVGRPINIGFGAGHFGGNVPEESKNCNQWNQLIVPGLEALQGNERSAGGPPLTTNDAISKKAWEDLVQHLFSDTPSLPALDDNNLTSRVDSLYSLLEKDTAPPAMRDPECSSDGGDIGAIQVDSDGFKRGLDPSPPGISRNDSLDELLLNLPKIASIPQFLFNRTEDSDE